MNWESQMSREAFEEDFGMFNGEGWYSKGKDHALVTIVSGAPVFTLHIQVWNGYDSRAEVLRLLLREPQAREICLGELQDGELFQIQHHILRKIGLGADHRIIAEIIAYEENYRWTLKVDRKKETFLSYMKVWPVQLAFTAKF